MEQVKKFSEEFFKNLKCETRWESRVSGSRLPVAGRATPDLGGDVLVVENVPKSFEDVLGSVAPYRLSFSDEREGCEFVGKRSRMLVAMSRYLEGAGKATLLRIEFDTLSGHENLSGGVDPEVEVKKRVGLKNCEIVSLTKSHKNSFFSRFSFVTSFNYLNESERVVSEIYVHNGKVVDGDLDGYTVVDGEGLKVDSDKVKKDYEIAKAHSVELSGAKQEEVGVILKERVEVEVARIREHYDRQLKELGGDLNGKLEKIREVELELKRKRLEVASGDRKPVAGSRDDLDVLKRRLERLRSGIVKAGDDEAVQKVLKDREMTIRDVMHKHSLNVSRKLMNTTVIYYPVYNFRLCLALGGHDSGEPSGNKGKRFLDVSYDPLTKSFGGLDCESCGKRLGEISLCEGGHICCGDCLDRCGECGGVFCVGCLKRGCGSCGRKLCKGCVKMCLGCGRSVCATHMRKDCVSGEDRCVLCLRACLRCNGMSEERYFGEALDGSKVCGKCLGVERQSGVLGRVFER